MQPLQTKFLRLHPAPPPPPHSPHSPHMVEEGGNYMYNAVQPLGFVKTERMAGIANPLRKVPKSRGGRSTRPGRHGGRREVDPPRPARPPAGRVGETGRSTRPAGRSGRGGSIFF
jgi:hypothetical protein